MIAQKYRFHGHGSLRFLFNRGQSIRTDFFILRHLNNKRRSDLRLAIIVSKKVDKRAVVRNRIRRRLYELFRVRFLSHDLNADLAVIVLKSELADLPAPQLNKIFEPIFEKLLKQYSAQKIN